MTGRHRPLCTIELIAEGHAERCKGEECAFWQDACVLARVESELAGRPEVAGVLLELRRALEQGREVPVGEALQQFHARLSAAGASEIDSQESPGGAEDDRG
jgi:hypothetical protein